MDIVVSYIRSTKHQIDIKMNSVPLKKVHRPKRLDKSI